MWNIECANWQELGLTPPDTVGFMLDGHFANNIMMNGNDYKYKHHRQNRDNKGRILGFLPVVPDQNLQTTNFDTYMSHVAKNNYHFNPENNVLIYENLGGRYFEDAEAGDFTLKSGNPAIGAGIAIPGITSSDNPDCGALEGSDRVLHAGANLNPIFKEKPESNTAIADVKATEKLKVFPNPCQGILNIQSESQLTGNEIIDIYSLSGKKLESYHADFINSTASIQLNNLPKGAYIVSIQGKKNTLLIME